MPLPDPLAALHPDRLPPMTGTGLLAEGLAALALGLALGWALVWVLRATLGRRPSRRRAALGALDRARGLAAPERLAAQVALLRAVAADLGLGTDWVPGLERRLRVRLGDLSAALHAPPGAGVPDLEPVVRRALRWMRE